jgi:hemerythrin-like domain-containing protein
MKARKFDPYCLGAAMSQDIAQQSELENSMLKVLMDGVRATVAWKVHGDDISRKLSTLRFIVQSLQRHLERLFSLEEDDGYMDLVKKKAPRLSRTVEALKLEHEEYRNGIKWIVHSLEQITSKDKAKFAAVCDEVLDFLEKLDKHGRKEIDLIQEAFEREVGGEG